jgi:hypothetical protein
MRNAILTATFADTSFAKRLGSNMGTQSASFWRRALKNPGKTAGVGPIGWDLNEVSFCNNQLVIPVKITTPGDETRLAKAFKECWNQHKPASDPLHMTACTAALT